MLRRRLPLLCLAALCGVSALPAAAPEPARSDLTIEEALRLAFPGCRIERGSAYLTEAELKLARDLAKVEVETRVARPYVARREGKVVGTAYFDTHVVRSLRETVMFAVDPEGRIARIELLAFAEPEEYIPRGGWYGQFVGRKLDEELNLKRGIRGVTGATLTARATTEAARRVLALHEVLRRRSGEKDEARDEDRRTDGRKSGAGRERPQG